MARAPGPDSFGSPPESMLRTGRGRSSPHFAVSEAVKAQPNGATLTILIAIPASCRVRSPVTAPRHPTLFLAETALAGTLMVGQVQGPRRSYADWLCFPFRDCLVHSLQSSTPKLLRFTVIRYPIGPDPGIALRPNGNMPFPYPIIIFVLAAKHGKVGKAILSRIGCRVSMPYKSSDAPDYGACWIRLKVSVQGPSSLRLKLVKDSLHYETAKVALQLHALARIRPATATDRSRNAYQGNPHRMRERFVGG